jgi:DNA-binding response OmpR family regulator
VRRAKTRVNTRLHGFGASPLNAGVEWHAPWNRRSSNMRSLPAPSPRRGSILLVEDRDDVRQGLAQLLDFNGYLVEEARDGVSALSYLERDGGSIALIVLDLVLPGSVSGRDVRGRMLADPVCSQIPTVIVTATEIDPPGRVGLHPAAWLEKPFRFDQLHDVVRRFVLPQSMPVVMPSDSDQSSSAKQSFHP